MVRVVPFPLSVVAVCGVCCQSCVSCCPSMASVSPSRLHAACTFATCTPCTTVVYHSALGPIRIQAVRTCAVTNTNCSLAVLCRTRSFSGDNFNVETVREIVGSFVDDSALPAAPPRKQPNKAECPSCCVRHIAWCTVLGGFAFISHAARWAQGRRTQR